MLGDWAAQRWPHHGRVTVCQISVGVGVPLSVLLFKASLQLAASLRQMYWMHSCLHAQSAGMLRQGKCAHTRSCTGSAAQRLCRRCHAVRACAGCDRIEHHMGRNRYGGRLASRWVACLPSTLALQHLFSTVANSLCLLSCCAACNNPIFSEIVPTHLRNLIFAFDRCGKKLFSA